MPELPSFAVVIPMYNEESGVQPCVRRVCAQLAKMPHRTSLIVVNDGSLDGTRNILSDLEKAEQKLVVVNHTRNQGYGAALRTGISQAASRGFEYVLFMDCDLTNDPADIPKFAAQMERGMDVIKASRFVAEGSMRGVPLRRMAFSYCGNWIARILFGVSMRDCTNGFRALKVAILKRMNLSETGFPIIVEELYQAKWLAGSYCEIPVILTARGKDQRPTSFHYRPETLRKYLKYALKAFLRMEPKWKEEIIA